MTFLVEALSKHLAPRTEVRRAGEYATVAEAIAAAQKIVDGFLQQNHVPGMDAKALFSHYRDHGEHPFIFRDDDKTLNVPGFNHVYYAMTRAKELCGGK
ncbi:MAG: hypothetical protein OEW79_02340 [Betaproteobacteria bacterium]|jgi:hypothetical protein|nr:hypothetical protein [Betaproteobacteria bacterium]MDH4293264.1 hypothetical protein [Betaproteobacteria bacterium]MDH5341653.1 hypothetical protein [Betaproteobacteria bacterium]